MENHNLNSDSNNNSSAIRIRRNNNNNRNNGELLNENWIDQQSSNNSFGNSNSLPNTPQNNCNFSGPSSFNGSFNNSYRSSSSFSNSTDLFSSLPSSPIQTLSSPLYNRNEDDDLELYDQKHLSLNVREEVDKNWQFLLLDDFECSLCCRLFYNPVTTVCGHTYCKNCLLSSLNYSPDCPICRRKLYDDPSKFEVNVSYVLASVLEKHFKEEYESRSKEEKDINITLSPTTTTTTTTNNTSNDQPQQDQHRRRTSTTATGGWWNSCLGLPCVLLYDPIC